MKDLTKGKPSALILSFALPIFLGNLLQLTYSLVDTRIVGSFLGEDALAAVGATSTLSGLIIGFLLGLSNGFAIITAQKFGAKNIADVACDRDWNIHFIYDSRTAIFETDLTFLKCAKASGSGGERIYRDHHSRTACNIFI